MVQNFYNSRIFIVSLLISIFIVLVMSINNKKHYYTLVLTPKIYNLDKKIYPCSDITNLLFATYYAVEMIVDNTKENTFSLQKEAFNQLIPWNKEKTLNFLSINPNFTVYPLSDQKSSTGLIEIKISNYKAIEEKLIKKKINEILLQMENYLDFDGDKTVYNTDIFKLLYNTDILKLHKEICKTYYKVVYENYKITKINIFHIFLISILAIYFFIFSLYQIKKLKLL
jgi:hypothetical protein